MKTYGLNTNIAFCNHKWSVHNVCLDGRMVVTCGGVSGTEIEDMLTSSMF